MSASADTMPSGREFPFRDRDVLHGRSMPRDPVGHEMDLRAVVGSILQAVQEAKRLADLESARLMEVYKKEKSLATFSVPAFTLAEAEVELRFAVLGPAEERPAAGNPPGLKVDLTATTLSGLDPSRVQVMKLKITPVLLRVLEEGHEE